MPWSRGPMPPPLPFVPWQEAQRAWNTVSPRYWSPSLIEPAATFGSPGLAGCHFASAKVEPATAARSTSGMTTSLDACRSYRVGSPRPNASPGERQLDVHGHRHFGVLVDDRREGVAGVDRVRLRDRSEERRVGK